MSADSATGGDRRAFAVVAVVVAVFLAAASAPSPLYAVWAQRFGFSSTTLTAVFAVYAISLLAALLTTGGLSDALGRRPVVLGALAVQCVGLVLFLVADGVMALYAGRLLQGLATGVVTAAASAWLLDVEPRPGSGALVNGVAPTAGLALGALLAGTLVQFGPAPLRTIWVVLLVAFAVAAVAVAALAEPIRQRRRLDLRPHVAVPRALRPALVLALPCLIATWALGGFYLSLGPSLLLQLEGSDNRLVAASAVVVLTGSGAITILGLRRLGAGSAMRVGSLALLVGVLVTITGVLTGSTAAFLAGTAVAGAGFGLAFVGAFRSLAALAAPAQRSGVVSAIYVISYLSFSLPALIAGAAATEFGLRAPAITYAAAVAALAVAALVLQRRNSRMTVNGDIVAA